MKYSIITPCYNSFETLRRTYQSLLELNHSAFEWILIDDCSMDEGKTKSLILQLVSEAPFPIKWKFLEKNYFGSRSVYEACLLAEGEYACILDHDDQLVPGALDIVDMWLNRFSEIEDVAGVCGRCVNENGVFIGTKLKFSPLVVNEAQLRFKYKVKGELFQFTKVDLLKKYFKLMMPGYTNGFVWAKISKEYRYVYVSDTLRVYDTALETSYSNNKVQQIRYPENKHAALIETLNSFSPYLFYNPIYSIRLSASAVRHAINAKKKSIFIGSGMCKPVLFFYIVSIPFGWLKSKKYL